MAVLKPGIAIARRFRVDSFVGGGGFGQVWKGYDKKLDRDVAIKRFNTESWGDSATRVKDAIDEARKVAAISRPHVVSIYDVRPYRGELLIIMEFLPGGTLHDHLRSLTRSGRWVDIPAVFDLLRGILHGLSAAHRSEHGPIIHRDLKPQNLLFAKDETIKITDFGLAAIGSVAAIATMHPGKWPHSGTWGYMSPEQLKGAPLDTRSDLFNVGLVAFLLFDASHPYVCHRLLFDYKEMVLSPCAPLSFCEKTELPDGIDGFIQTLLAENPDARFHTAEDTLTELDIIEGRYDDRVLDLAIQWHDALRTGASSRPSMTAEVFVKGIHLLTKRGFYTQATFLYEKCGIDLSSLTVKLSSQLDQDLQACRRKAGKEVVPA